MLFLYPSGAIDALSITDEKYFKPSREDFRPPPPSGDNYTTETKHGWHFKAGSYLLLPFEDAFKQQFPSQYTVMLTIRPSKDMGDVSKLTQITVKLPLRTPVNIDPSFFTDLEE